MEFAPIGIAFLLDKPFRLAANWHGDGTARIRVYCSRAEVIAAQAVSSGHAPGLDQSGPAAPDGSGK